MNDPMFLIYLLNLFIVVGMFIVTIYRAWIEHEQLKARKKIEIIKTILEKEADVIREMSGDEFIDALKSVFED